MNKFFKCQLAGMLLVSALFFISCAVEPIKISKPVGVPVAQNKVSGFNVRVSIEDARDTQIVGSRGGLYSETSLISTDEGLVNQIGDNFILAMKNQGYQLVKKAPANMQVKLEVLTYKVDEINRTTKDSFVSAKMSFYVEHKEGYIEKSFIAKVEQTTVLLPTQKNIEALINDALIDVMQSGLNDQDIQSYIEYAQNLSTLPVSNISVEGGGSEEAPEPSDSAPDAPINTQPVESKTYKILL